MDSNMAPNVSLETIDQSASQQVQVYQNLTQRIDVLVPRLSNKRTILAQGVQDKFILSDFQKTKDFKASELNESSAKAQLILNQTSDKTDELHRIIGERRAFQQSDIINYEHQAAEKAETFKQGPLLFSRMKVSLQMANMRKDREFLERQINEGYEVFEELLVHLYNRLVVSKGDGSAEESSLESVRKNISSLLENKNENEDQKKQLENEEQQLEAAIKRKTAVMLVAKQQYQ